MTDMTKRQKRLRKMGRWTVYSLLLVLVLPLIPYAINAANNANESKPAQQFLQVPNPGGELWRDVRQRDRQVTGNTQMKSVESGVLINKSGEDWRQFRMQTLVTFGYTLLGVVLALILLFHLIRGPHRLPDGFSGKTILRFTYNERLIHWLSVGLFWLLGLTGLILLYGRFVLIPVLGPAGFSFTAEASKVLHNFAGPAFLVMLIILFFTFVKDNMPTKQDIVWLSKAGGLLSNTHVSSGRFNGGEKFWFWIISVVGTLLCITGLILDFPIFEQTRETMALSHMIHGIAAIVVISVSLGHAYLGLAGMEGSLSSMTTGYVDENWAKEHHDLWYEDVKNQPESSTTEAGGVPTGGVAQPRRDQV